MPQPLQFRYSINSALLGMLLPLIFMTITFNNLRYSYLSHYNFTLIFIAVADLLFISYSVFILIKRFIPAAQGQIALELNEQGINDYIRNIVIDWSYVDNLALEYGRNAAKLIVSLNSETEYGTEVVIRLRWIQGRDQEIFDEAYAYFERMNAIK